MNPNETTAKMDDIIREMFMYESELHKQFAYWPKRIDKQWVWLTHYYIQYLATSPFMFNAANKKIIHKCYTAEWVLAETLKGNIVDGKLLTTRKRRFGKRSRST